MARKNMLRFITVFFLCSLLLVPFTLAQNVAPFNASGLVKLGDKTQYGIYTIYKIGEGIYQISDHELHQPDGLKGATGSAMYLIVGEKKAMIIDLGNDYIDGAAQDNLKPRKNAAEEFRAVVYGLAGKRPIEAAVTHMHLDHDGMTGALMNRSGVTLWASDKEDVNAVKQQHGIDPSVFTAFAAGRKSFDLGGGRVVNTFLVRGHTLGSTLYILKKDGLIFTGDAFVGVDASERFKFFAEDTQKLVDYINANFSPYERYGLRVYPAHAHTVGDESISSDKPAVDIAFKDWRFLQEMALLAKGVIQAKWLVKGSGLRYEEELKSDASAPPGGEASGQMAYGVATVRMSLKNAYAIAGLKMPQ